MIKPRADDGVRQREPRRDAVGDPEDALKAVRFYQHGGPEVLHYEEVDRPRPAAGQVLVEVSTATPAVGDADRSVRGIGMQLHPDVTQLAAIAKKVDTGELRVDVSASYPLAEIPRCTS
ncbi:hypothetical protein AB0L41_47680 [Amycolatopsis mediterranei]|uniref:hypothetical protein n=1 Tax=Amycolatopsis mediterranei TaxID=33910 RepID=UPI00342403CF